MKTDELIELANQSNWQVKGALVVEAAKTTTIHIKNKLVVRSIETKEEAKNVVLIKNQM